ncbi:hypothetical protein [Rhodococcus opacus]|uniref:hypothetical protein n=1 Tax=Rhodococcus opacus TaxID=37919 RepID=UPI001F58BBAB|nr:hypothetical protein [Rhodococcus opacus]UNN01611.1 hypothetical protein MOO23_03705 [Rhodococcus opacus]
MGDNRPFGFDPDDLDRVIREAGEELQGVKNRIVRFLDQADSQIPWTGVFADFARSPRGASKPETTGETGDGVWAIYTLDGEGVARVEQVYATELDALRAHKHNTDPHRSVRFLPYGVTVSVLDQPEEATPPETE